MPIPYLFDNNVPILIKVDKYGTNKAPGPGTGTVHYDTTGLFPDIDWTVCAVFRTVFLFLIGLSHITLRTGKKLLY